MATTQLPPVPYKTPLNGPQGLITTPWSTWFRQLFNRVGGNNSDLLVNPMTAIGDLIYGSTAGTPDALSGNTSTTKKYLTQTGTGSESATPAWNAFDSADIPAASVTNAKLATMSNNTVKGNQSGSTTTPSDIALGDLSLPSMFTLSGGSKALVGGAASATLTAQAKNKFLAGPTTGADASPTFRALATEDFVAPTVQRFTSGSGTYTTPTSPRTPLYLKVTVVGGGSGGAGQSANSSAASDSTFGSITAKGGAASGSANSANTTAYTVIENFIGGVGTGAASDTGGAGGHGGSNPCGGAGGGGYHDNTGKSAQANTGGAGGGGGGTGAAAASAGGNAGGYVKAIISSPSSTYSYGVGAGSSGGTGAPVGGDGAAGIVIVEEYYQ